MVDEQPVAELDARYSGPGATAQSWARADGQLRAAELFWISTVRPDGRPHVTPLVAVWLDGSMFFSTGPTERKAKNLAANPNCILTTGQNSWNEGFDIVVEGAAERLTVLVTPSKAQFFTTNPLMWSVGRPLTSKTSGALVHEELVIENGPNAGGKSPVWLL